MKTTDTPRTNAYNNTLGIVPAVFARKLERELKRANDEIEFYEKVGQEKVDELRASNAEVERLREYLIQAVEIAEVHMEGVVSSPRKDKLDAIQANLHLDTKGDLDAAKARG